MRKEKMFDIHEDAILAVKNGIYWLDENHPDWVSRIDLSALDMSECENCIIGQAVGYYSDVVRRGQVDYNAGVVWAVEHGFEWPSALGRNEYGYEELDTLWSDEVRKRLG